MLNILSPFFSRICKLYDRLEKAVVTLRFFTTNDWQVRGLFVLFT